MKTLLRLLLKSQHQQNRSGLPQTEKGMTLIELLIGTVMAFLIITPMLGFVVDMLNTDRREQVKSNTEQDIQAAVDFIAQDLSQAIYIYDNGATGIPELINKKFIPTETDRTPILVFWKRQQLTKSVPINSTVSAQKPSDCKSKPDECNDYYVLSLVAYYQIREADPKSIWCQPSGNDCPTRIARYEIRDGVKNPSPADPTKPYYTLDPKEPGSPDEAFNTADFDINKPAENVTMGRDKFKNPEVLVNYIDHSPRPAIQNECTTALGTPTITTGVTPTLVPETTLRIPAAPPDTVNSFYACVDTSRNLARVTIRGNSLRRLQANDANYNASKSAFFPIASVQVQGLGDRGK